MTPPREEAERLLAIAGRDARAFRVLAASPEVDPVVALFHAQHAVEKSLKAVLSLHNVEFRRTHDLLLLATLLDDSGLDVPIDKEILRLLVPYAAQMRDEVDRDALISPARAELLVESALTWAELRLGE